MKSDNWEPVRLEGKDYGNSGNERDGELWEGDPDCNHDIVNSSGGGVHCT